MCTAIASTLQIAIPDGDVIPEFGTVQEQAAYALGGQPGHMYLVNETNNILFVSLFFLLAQ